MGNVAITSTCELTLLDGWPYRKAMGRTTVSIDQLFSMTKAAKILGCSRATIYNHVHKGLLMPIVVGNQWRLTATELERFAKEGGRIF